MDTKAYISVHILQSCSDVPFLTQQLSHRGPGNIAFHPCVLVDNKHVVPFRSNEVHDITLLETQLVSGSTFTIMHSNDGRTILPECSYKTIECVVYRLE